MIPLYITEFQSSPVRTWGTGRGAGRHGGSASPPRGLRRLEGPSSMPDLPSLHRGRHGRSPLCALPLFQRATILSSALQGQGVRSSPRKVTASRALFQTPRLTAPRPPPPASCHPGLQKACEAPRASKDSGRAASGGWGILRRDGLLSRACPGTSEGVPRWDKLQWSRVSLPYTTAAPPGPCGEPRRAPWGGFQPARLSHASQ